MKYSVLPAKIYEKFIPNVISVRFLQNFYHEFFLWEYTIYSMGFLFDLFLKVTGVKLRFFSFWPLWPWKLGQNENVQNMWCSIEC